MSGTSASSAFQRKERLTARVLCSPGVECCATPGPIHRCYVTFHIGHITQPGNGACTLAWTHARTNTIKAQSATRARLLSCIHRTPDAGQDHLFTHHSHLAPICVAVTVLTPVISESKGSDERYRDVLLPTSCNRCLLRKEICSDKDVALRSLNFEASRIERAMAR